MTVTPHGMADVRPRRPVESVDPATGAVWRRFEPTTEVEVRSAVAVAREAQPGWYSTPVAARVATLRRFHELLFRRRAEVAALISRENGKPVAEAMATEVAVVLDFALFNARHAARFVRAPWTSASAIAMKRKRIRVLREPFGVVAVISPWNYPFMLAAGSLLPALVTGNAA